MRHRVSVFIPTFNREDLVAEAIQSILTQDIEEAIEIIIIDELKQAIAKRVFGFSYPLHTAKLGMFYRLLVTLVGIAFALMSIFGLVSYLKRNRPQ